MISVEAEVVAQGFDAVKKRSVVVLDAPVRLEQFFKQFEALDHQLLIFQFLFQFQIGIGDGVQRRSVAQQLR